jgi:hypothetical protein
MNNVRWLDLQNTGVNAHALSVLADWPNATRILMLDLSRDVEVVSPDPLGQDGIAVLRSHSALSRLESLDLSNQDIGSPGAAVLARWQDLVSVRELRLAGNQIDDRGARVLADSSFVRNLRWLDLSDNEITDAGADALLSSWTLSELGMLTLTDDPAAFSPPVARRLAERFPGCFDWWPPVFEPLP